MTITKDTIIGDILTIAPDTAPLFLEIGMHCLGCPASRGETVEQACMVHGVEVEELLAKAALGARLSIHPPEAESDLKRAPRCPLQCSGSVHPTASGSEAHV